jgi:hypothetical protein
MMIVGPVGTVKKPSVVGEAFSSRGGKTAFFADFHRGVSFHRPPAFLLLVSFFVLIPSFPQRNFVPGSSRNADRQHA